MQAGRAGIAERCVAQDLMRKRNSWLLIAHRSDQAEHFHGLEDALNVATAAVVATKPQADMRLAQIENRRNAAFQFHIAEMIEHNTGIRRR